MQATVPQRVLIDFVIPSGWTQTQRNRIAVDVVLILGFAAFVSICAQLAIRFPTTTVPITGQTLGVLLTGGTLGSVRGGLSMLTYMLMGMISLPVFAPTGSLLGEENIHFILPWAGTDGFVWELSSGGYIVGFILAAYLVGLLAERGWDRRPSMPIAMIVGNVAVYLVGLPWLALFIASEVVIPGTSITYYDAISGNHVLDKTLKGGLYPFIGGDAIKLLAATMALPGAWAITKWVKGRDSSG
ncbi:MAG: biotin transporter BioY [SAR202 cluster bacterium]|nr:biotin transporter BioY [SAR202 cluster bacterium]